MSFYFAEKFDSHDISLYKSTDFNIPLLSFNNKVLVFVGVTGLGKTQFALSHFRKPLHIRDKEHWGRYSTTIDDLDFPLWPPLTFLKLLDLENPITQNVKYGSVRIRAGVNRIICVNHEDLLWSRNIHDETKLACERRIEIHRLYNKLYNERRVLGNITNVQQEITPGLSLPDVAVIEGFDDIILNSFLTNTSFKY